MNLFLVYAEELCGNPTDSKVILEQNRALYALERHNLNKIGTKVKAGILNGDIGEIELLEIIKEPSLKLIFRGNFFQKPLKKLNCDLVVGIPRPQTVKKLIQVAVSFGINNLYFFRMEKTHASYCSSNIWQTENLNKEIFESLEQVVDTVPVHIHLEKQSNLFARDYFNNLIDNYKQIVFFDIDSSDQKINLNNNDKTLLILGPEAGFSEREKSWLTSNEKIQSASLGGRMIRLEHATCAAIQFID
jgi:16S rRNA (uracil1498-N3)-methyltransferase